MISIWNLQSSTTSEQSSEADLMELDSLVIQVILKCNLYEFLYSDYYFLKISFITFSICWLLDIIWLVDWYSLITLSIIIIPKLVRQWANSLNLRSNLSQPQPLKRIPINNTKRQRCFHLSAINIYPTSSACLYVGSSGLEDFFTLMRIRLAQYR